MKPLLSSAVGVVVATLVLTSHWFARETHGNHRDRVITAVVIVVAFFLVGVLVARGGKPKTPVTPSRPVSPFSGSNFRR